MSPLRPAHVVRLLRRAAILEGISGDARGEPRDPTRAATFHRIVEKISYALQDGGELIVTPEERAALAAEADELAERAACELQRTDRRDLERGEEWLYTAQALREVLDAVRLEVPMETHEA